MPAQKYDVAIVGGGLVGASLAAALAPLRLNIGVVEASANTATPPRPKFPQRTLALTDNARRIYQGIGVWDEIAEHAEPIHSIHISDRGHFGMTHLRAADVGVRALGYVVDAPIVGAALYKKLGAAELFCPYKVSEINQSAAAAQIKIINSSSAAAMELYADLVVVADGGRSQLATQLGINIKRRAYRQSAIVTNLRSDKPHRGRAYERFTREGPIALLPMRADGNANYEANSFAVVWTCANENLDARLALTDAKFLSELQNAFGGRAGNFFELGARNSYPLHHTLAARAVAARAVLVGDASHVVHPVAGQGFNLGLRDVAVLAEIISDAHAQNNDINNEVAARYPQLRARETRRVGSFTDCLIKVFASNNPAMRLGRNLALLGIELFPPTKKFLLRRTLGLASVPTRLSSGARLNI